jgi:ABC-2 type transport system permease protein
MEYILPGIIMMGVILSAFMHSVSSYYFSKFQRTIEEIVVSPTPYYIVLLGYTIGGVIRGSLIASLIALVGIFFTDIHIHSYILMSIMVILTSAFFALLGITNGIFAKSFDGISIIPNFFITPLTYLGGVFYSIKLLPPFWQTLSQFNPILYMVDGFRYSMLGVSDINIFNSLVLLTTLVVVFFGVNLFFFRSGRGFRL